MGRRPSPERHWKIWYESKNEGYWCKGDVFKRWIWTRLRQYIRNSSWRFWEKTGGCHLSSVHILTPVRVWSCIRNMPHRQCCVRLQKRQESGFLFFLYKTRMQIYKDKIFATKGYGPSEIIFSDTEGWYKYLTCRMFIFLKTVWNQKGCAYGASLYFPRNNIKAGYW